MAVQQAGPGAADEGCSLLLPRRSLSGCIFAAIVRDTRGVPLTPQERVNYFPAAPFCAVSLFFEGQSHMAKDWSPAGIREAMPEPLPNLVFSGPQGGPTVSINPGPVHAMFVGLYPEAIQALLDIDIGRWRDRIVPADAVFDTPLLTLLETTRSADSATDAFERLQDGLDPLWQSIRPRRKASPHWLTDWTHHLLQQAAISGVGRSLRQVERRMKTWTGQSRRDLANLVRLEVAFADAMQRMPDDKENWAELAAANGFSDQPHLVREVRRNTGFPPARLRERIKTDRAFWYYRLIGELY